ncbi:assembly/transport component in curli production [Salmonella enterica subsp. enterica]|uniref:Curli production assembly/transport component CsgE n=1 Tax=Salmonella enterica I TaxID=59201 RepID=A0A447U5H2_SALET|nr:assembly/transport component in curli production [Salmonella enterica subsp. enterica]
MLTDHTVSSIGHEFYRAFSDKWESEYTGNLTINERPSARWGSWITITVNQDVIFQTFLFPNEKRLRENRRLRISAKQRKH